MTKRILIINPSSLTDFDGKTLRLVRYAQAFKEMGYQVDFLASSCASSELKNKYHVLEAPISMTSVFKDNYQPVLTEVSNVVESAHRFCNKVFCTIKRGGYSAVLSSFSASGLPTLAAITVAKVKGIPHIYDYDDLGPEMSRVMKGWTTTHPFYKAQLFMEKVICQHSDATFAMSEMMKNLLVRTRSNRKIEVIHNVPPSREFGVIKHIEQSRKELGIPTDAFIFAYLGNIQRQIRGLETLVDGVNVLKNNGNGEDFLVLVIGTGTGEGGLKEKISRLGLSKYFLFTGAISKEKAISYLNAANVSLIILPAIQADYMAPTKLFISMALGKHIIATDSKQIRLILGSTPIFVKKNCTAKEIAEAMLKGTTDFRVKEVNEKYRKLFLGRYCWEKKKKKFVRLIENLC